MDLRTMKRLLLLLSIATMPFIAFGQKKEMIEDKEAIMARAARALDSAIQPGTDLHEAIIKEKLIGKYLLQVSFREKGANVLLAPMSKTVSCV